MYKKLNAYSLSDEEVFPGESLKISILENPFHQEMAIIRLFKLDSSKKRDCFDSVSGTREGTNP